MKAFVLTSFDAPPALRDDLPAPTPAEGEVLVRVRASSANPVDNAIAGGMLQGMLEHDFPITLGRDYAGVVEAGGSRWGAGDEVYGFVLHASPNVHDGSWAELIAVPEDNLSRAPESVDLAAAGATVIAPALPEDEAYLRDLGVTDLIERGATAPADALLDLVSYTPEDFEANAAGLKDGGRGVSPIGAAGDGPGRASVMAVPSPKNLERLAGLLDDGTVRVPIQDTYGLDQTGEALAALGGSHTQGKLAIRVA